MNNKERIFELQSQIAWAKEDLENLERELQEELDNLEE